MNRILDSCSIPAFLEPWLTRFYSSFEIDLIEALSVHALAAAEVKKMLGHECTDSFLERAWRRGVVQRLDDGRLLPAAFHVRFESWALFEGWQGIPQDIKDKLNRWELEYYLDRHRDIVEQLKTGYSRSAETICPEYLLLDEVARLFDRIPRFYLWPCNCRAMIRGCSQSQLTCIRFSNERGIGWKISRERALSIVHDANRQGLMQSAELGMDSQGRFDGALCNCCNDCCFPHRLAREFAAEKIWPLSRYLAQLDADVCNGCGRCVRRCPFDAISQAKKTKGKPAATPLIDNSLCRGCGVCATGCPPAAIGMLKIRESEMEACYG